MFVCFAETPNALMNNHAEMYEHLHSAWLKIYPNYEGEGDGNTKTTEITGTASV